MQYRNWAVLLLAVTVLCASPMLAEGRADKFTAGFSGGVAKDNLDSDSNHFYWNVNVYAYPWRNRSGFLKHLGVGAEIGQANLGTVKADPPIDEIFDVPARYAYHLRPVNLGVRYDTPTVKNFRFGVLGGGTIGRYTESYQLRSGKDWVDYKKFADYYQIERCSWCKSSWQLGANFGGSVAFVMPLIRTDADIHQHRETVVELSLPATWRYYYISDFKGFQTFTLGAQITFR